MIEYFLTCPIDWRASGTADGRSHVIRKMGVRRVLEFMPNLRIVINFAEIEHRGMEGWWLRDGGRRGMGRADEGGGNWVFRLLGSLGGTAWYYMLSFLQSRLRSHSKYRIPKSPTALPPTAPP